MLNRKPPHGPADWLSLAIKMTAIAALVLFTNFGFQDRLELLIANDRWFTFVFYNLVWIMSLGAIVIAAFQPAQPVRLFWAFALSFSCAAGFAYTRISGSSLTVFDILSLWVARHEAGRAMQMYTSGAGWAVVVFVCSFYIIAAPVNLARGWLQTGLKWLSWVPATPVLVIAAIVIIKQGGGSQAMPSQFQPLAISMVSAIKGATHKTGPRQKVAISPRKSRQIRNILYLVDESVRGDIIDWRPGNRTTPFLATMKDSIANFGIAVSAANCSSYANAILRFGAMPANLTVSAATNPTIWQYAKKAGYRTVFIDGQSGFVRDPGKLQNFMTVTETAFIDKMYQLDGIATEQLDFEVLAIIRRELSAGVPVFIYANKNGAHFPYDAGYPPNWKIFAPTLKETGTESPRFRENSYRNVIRWAVDHFFDRLFTVVDLTETALIYTSDHGQNLSNGHLTHCSTTNPDPVEGLVPLFATTGDKALLARFQQGAALNFNHTSHFAIAATMLELMGYAPTDVAANYLPPLFVKYTGPLSFSYRDIFGVFSGKVNWVPVIPHTRQRLSGAINPAQ